MNHQEIEKAAKESWKTHKDEEYDFEMDGDYFKDGFITGANFVLESASEGFEEWFKKVDREMLIDIPKDDAFEMWQACAISKDMEIEELKKDLSISVGAVLTTNDYLKNHCSKTDCFKVEQAFKGMLKKHGLGGV